MSVAKSRCRLPDGFVQRMAQPAGGESGEGSSPAIGRKLIPAFPCSISFGTLSSNPWV